LDKLLDSVTFSQEVGAEKPAPEIFSKALERAHCAPSEAVHVGDSLRADVEGARRSGLQAVWLNRTNQPSSTDCLTISTLEELPSVLELIKHLSSSPR
jgi:FMN phosphatase YigB (HAD superfamily)